MKKRVASVSVDLVSTVQLASVVKKMFELVGPAVGLFVAELTSYGLDVYGTRSQKANAVQPLQSLFSNPYAGFGSNIAYRLSGRYTGMFASESFPIIDPKAFAEKWGKTPAEIKQLKLVASTLNMMLYSVAYLCLGGNAIDNNKILGQMVKTHTAEALLRGTVHQSDLDRAKREAKGLVATLRENPVAAYKNAVLPGLLAASLRNMLMYGSFVLAKEWVLGDPAAKDYSLAKKAALTGVAMGIGAGFVSGGTLILALAGLSRLEKTVTS